MSEYIPTITQNQDPPTGEHMGNDHKSFLAYLTSLFSSLSTTKIEFSTGLDGRQATLVLYRCGCLRTAYGGIRQAGK